MKYVIQSNAHVGPSQRAACIIAKHAKSLIYRHDRLIADIPDDARFDALIHTLGVPSVTTRTADAHHVLLTEDVEAFRTEPLFARLIRQAHGMQPVSTQKEANE